MTSLNGYSPLRRIHLWGMPRRLLLLTTLVFTCLILNTVGAGAQTGDDHGNFLSTATPLSLGSSLTGRIDPGSDRDFFELDLSSASSQSDLWVYTTGELDTIGWLFDAEYRQLAEDDDLTSGEEDNFHLRAIVPSGVYYVEVRSAEMETGDYTIHAKAVTAVGSTTGTATTLSVDSPVPGTIDMAEDADYFRFSITEPLNLALRGVSGNDDPIYGSIVDSIGTEIDVNVRTGFRIEDDFDPGTYFLRVSTPVEVTSHPIPYTIHAYEDTEYTDFLEDCGDATDALTNPQITDSLYGCQWHLNNSDGEDINIEEIWAEGIDGTGVNVSVVDDGMDHSHEDLIDNVDASRNHDYTGGGDIHHSLEHHGTNVAGVIAARANSLGVRGVAPLATIYGYNFLAGSTDLNLANAMTRNGEITAVSNNSWGSRGPGLSQVSSFWEIAIESGIRSGYNGKGTFYVFSGGNNHLTGGTSNLRETTNFYGVTAACAVNDADKRSSYSNMGANLWVCAPSGDRGEDHRGIVTTENSDRYHNGFSGTSASAPIVSGVAALMRQSNPDLTWREMKLILAASARKNDPTNTGWVEGAQKFGADSASDRYHFNHEYGFGMVDAGAAVAMAKEWSGKLLPLQTAVVESDYPSIRIPDASANGPPTTVTQTLTMETAIEFIEFVEVNVSFQHDSFRDLEIRLVSPSGAESTLTVPFDTFNDDDPEIDFIPLRDSFRFGSARHLGEDPNGEWKLLVTDNLEFEGGTLEAWDVTVYGHGPIPSAPAVESVTPGAGTLTVSWTPPSQSGGSPIAEYDLRYIQSAVGDFADANWIEVENIWNASSGGSLEFTIPLLVGGAQHQVQVRAVNSKTSGPWSDAQLATPDRITTNACASGAAVANPPVHPSLVLDCNSLLAARDVLAGNTTLNWSANTPIADWEGITVGGSPLRVTELELYDSQLTGSVPSELRSLDNLQVLHLGGNDLTGPIPAWLGEMDSLLALVLWGNQFAGSIPSELSRLHSLQVLSVSGERLTGVMPEWLGDLGNLVRLYVYDTRLSGSVPSTLANLSDLQRLSLWGNDLTGPMPAWLGGLTKLEQLSLGGNQLTGTIPTELGSLANLEVLRLYNNRLNGPIPSEFGSLTNLEVLSLGGNQMSGSIPTEIGVLSNLREIYLWGNDLTGTVPSELGNLSNLTELWLSNNELSGSIPMELEKLSNLKVLILWGNEFTGLIPPEMGNLSNLTVLSLSSNHLAGSIPRELGNLSNLTELYLRGNQFTGCIPESLRSVEESDLDDIDLPFCDVLLSDLTFSPGSLTPAFDPYLENYYVGSVTASQVTAVPTNEFNATFQFLDENHYELADASPSQAGHQVDLSEDFTTIRIRVVSQDSRASNSYTVLVSRTPLESGSCTTGNAVANPADNRGLVSDCDALLSVRDALGGNGTLNWSADTPIVDWDGITVTGRIQRVTALDLSDRQLAGTIPAELSQLDSLERLSLAQNSLTGPMPVELGSFRNLEVLSLWDNQLTDTIPDTLGNLASLEHLILSGNQLSGAIPASLGNLSNLRSLRLHGNQVTGAIPGSLGDLSGLEYLSLSQNQLSGTIPDTLGTLTNLEYLYLWDNQLSGTIPDSTGNLSNLLVLSLSRNQLTGHIPASLGDLTDLTTLSLWANRLTGTIPVSLGNLVNLETLYLSQNQLTGCVPASLQGVPNNDLDQMSLPPCEVQLPVNPTAILAATSTKVRIDSLIQVTATFSEPVTGFEMADVVVANGLVSSFVGRDGDSVFTFDVTPNAIGVVTVDVSQDAAVDSEGNGNTAAAQLRLGMPYDDDNDGNINGIEVLNGVRDYFLGILTGQQVLQLVSLYFSSPG